MSHRGLLPALAVLALSAAVGCGRSEGPQSQSLGSAIKVSGGAAPEPAAPQQPAQPAPAPPGNPPAANAPPPGIELPPERKIVFTGTLEVEVKDFAAARVELDGLVKQFKAYYAKTEVAGDSGKKRHGTFVIKVPVENFQPLVDGLAALGNPVKNATDSQDVTEEFVDVSARVKNLKAEEETLNKLLKEAAGRLDDIFRIREQIRQVRGEIERNEARVQALGKMAALSTVTLTLREIEPYTAPNVPRPSEPPPPPTFGERASGTFTTSVDALRALGEAVALFLVAIAPWLPVVLVLAVPGYYGLRMVARSHNGLAQTPRSPAAPETERPAEENRPAG